MSSTTSGHQRALAGRSKRHKDDDDDDESSRSGGGQEAPEEGKKEGGSKQEEPKEGEEGKKDEEKKDEPPKEGGEPKEGEQKEPEKKDSKEPEKKDSKEPEKKGSKEPEKKDSKEPEKKGSKEPEKKGSKEQEKKEEEKPPEKEGEKPPEKEGEKPPEKEGEKPAEKEGEKKEETPKPASKEKPAEGEKPEGEGKEKDSKLSGEGTATKSTTKSTVSKGSDSKGKTDKKAKEIEGKLTGALAFATFAVTLGSFQFGYSIGCVNAPGQMITEWVVVSHAKIFNKTLTKEEADVVWSIIVSAFPVGGAVGGLVSGVVADKAGRRGGLLYTNILTFLAGVLMGTAKYANFYPMMIAGRFLIGIYAGLSILVPIYLTEVSPTKLRGMLGSLHQLLVTISILVSQILGLPQILGNEERWPFIFYFILVPTVVQILALPLIPESPKYTLCMRGNAQKATEDLRKLRGTKEVSAEVDMMQEEAEAAKASAASKPSMGDMFKGSLRWPMTIAIALMLTQQLSGINAVMFYSTVIFKTAGLSDQGAVYATIAMGTVNVLMTIVSVWLVDHPKAGRRSLLIIGLIGMWLTTVLLVVCISLAMGGQKSASYGAIAFVLLYVISFATGAGSIPWFFVSEIFHSNARGNANAIATMTNWGANVIVSLIFLPLNNAIKQYSILVFTVCVTIALIFVWKYVPETKGKTIDEITAELEKK